MGAPVAMTHFDAWLREAPAPVIDHRRFGPLRASLRRESEFFLWECLDLVATARGRADLEFEAGAYGPGIAHERQLDVVVANLDQLTEAAARVVTAELGDLGGGRSELSERLEWQGATLTGRAGEFQLRYWSSDALIAVQFEQSRPIFARLED